MRIIVEQYPEKAESVILNDVTDLILIAKSQKKNVDMIHSGIEFLSYSNCLLERKVNDAFFVLTDE